MNLRNWRPTLPSTMRWGAVIGLIAVVVTVWYFTRRDAWDVIQATPEFTAYRINGQWEGEERERFEFLQLWPILEAKPVAVGPLSERIRSVLTSPRSFGGDPAECFWPGMGFRFEEDGSAVVVLICLSCSQAYFYREGEQVRTEVLSGKGHADLLAIYQELFPAAATEKDANAK